MQPLYRPLQPEMSAPDNRVVYREYHPSLSLSPYISCYWTLHSACANPDFLYHAVPDACVDIFINFARYDHCLLVGIASKAVSAPVDAGCDYFGVRFLPGQIGAFFLLPAAEIHDRAIDFRDLAGGEFAETEKRLIAARSLSERILLIESFLFRRLAGRFCPCDDRFQKTLVNIYTHGGMKSVKELSDDASLSTRQLDRLFSTNLGLRPKMFSRIIRFQNTLRFILSSPRRLTDAALDCGYYDQSHFINEFARIYGKKPQLRNFHLHV